MGVGYDEMNMLTIFFSLAFGRKQMPLIKEKRRSTSEVKRLLKTILKWLALLCVYS